MRFAVLIFLTTAAIGSGTAHADPGAVISVPDVAIGPVAFGSTAVQYATIENVGTSPKTPLVVTNAAIDSPSADFTFASTGCDGAINCPLALSITDTAALLAVRCTGTLPGYTETATITFQSNTNGGAPFVSHLSCSVGDGGSVTATPSVLAFGNVDLHDPLPVITIRLQNSTPTAVAITTLMFAGSTAFTTPVVVGAIVPANGELPIPVTYTPTAEDVVDQGTLQILEGTAGGQFIDLAGTGVDRHASIAAVATFPDTPKNPGFAAPELPITIQNTGLAVLGLTDAAITGAPTWTLVNPEPVDMPGASKGASTYDFLVRFAPSAAGPATPATFTVATTDPAHPTLTAVLTGNGVDRLATMSPDDVDLHITGIDTTVYGSDPSRGVSITVTNTDPARTYTIASIPVLGGEGAFQVLDTSGELAPGASRSFDISFRPPYAGEFEGTATLFLDMDPTPQAQIKVHGIGTFVGAHGGGGCSSAGDGGGVVLVAIALGFMIRKRRAALLVIAAGTAHAGGTRDLDLALFDPTPSTTSPMFALQTAEVGDEGAWAVTALVTYANDPLVLTSPTNDNVTIADRTTMMLGGAFAFGERFEVGLHVPLYVQSGQDLSSSTMFGEPEVSGTVLGDLELHAKAQLVRTSGPGGTFVAGLATGLALPTAKDQEFAGSARPQLRVLALAGYAPPISGSWLELDLNAGGVIRGDAQYDNIDQKDGFDWGAAATVRAHPSVAIAAEVFGELVPGGLGEPMGPAHVLDTAEALVGVHLQLDRSFNVGLAIGRGLTTELGSPAVRGVLSLTFAPTARVAPDRARSTADDDHDGIPNDVDKCPNQPEDKDGFQDADGCPDPDNDNDGIPDAVDKCPNEPEDKDGFQDADGCPDPDNDRDGIPDHTDKCPNEPETINGFQDDDGCPDQGIGLVTIGTDRLEVGEAIKFTPAGKIDPTSFNVLGQIGATLRAHLELSKIRIVTHVAAVHAVTIRDWLIQYGISRDRLEPASKLDSNASPTSDERIDLIVTEKL